MSELDRKMTEEEKKIVDDNIMLVYKYMHDKNINNKHFADYQDIESDLLLTLCRCAMSYRGDNNSTFANYCYTAFGHTLWKRITYEQAQKRGYDSITLSLNMDSDDGNYDYLEMYYADESLNPEVKYLSSEAKEEARQRAYDLISHVRKQGDNREVLMDIIDKLLDGYRCAEIASIYGTSRQAIDNKLKRLRAIRRYYDNKLEG